VPLIGVACATAALPMIATAATKYRNGFFTVTESLLSEKTGAAPVERPPVEQFAIHRDCTK
jgi:hypothetical protein